MVEAGSKKRLNKVLNDIVLSINGRQKIIRLADRSAAGWDTVNEYLPDQLASDSEDDKKLRQVENSPFETYEKVSSSKISISYSSAMVKFAINYLRYPTAVASCWFFKLTVSKSSSCCIESTKTFLSTSPFLVKALSVPEVSSASLTPVDLQHHCTFALTVDKPAIGNTTALM